MKPTASGHMGVMKTLLIIVVVVAVALFLFSYLRRRT
jgi:hypothetical protein